MEPADIKLPTEICKNTLNEIIKKNLLTENYTVDICEGSNKGDNYIGIIYRVKATIKPTENLDISNGNANKKKDISIIVKLPPQNEARRDQFSVGACFARESLVYDEIMPLYMNYQETKGLTNTEKFYEIPKCYKTITIEKEECLFLEDLRTEGFNMFDRHDQVTFHHVRLVMEILGKLHALSFALKDQDYEKIEKFTKLKDIFTERENDTHFNEWMVNMSKRAVKTLDEELDKEYIEKFNKLLEKNFMDVLRDNVSGDLATPYAVISHGDCWNNNILYKNNKDGEAIQARLLDWQISRYSSPACDLMYYIFGCTSKELRDKHYHNFLEIYHKSLSDLLRRLGSDPEKLFPFSALESQLKTFGKFGLLMAMIVLPIFTSDAEDTPDLDDLAEKLKNGTDVSEMNFNSEKTQSLYDKRMSDVIRDMAKLGYI